MAYLPFERFTPVDMTGVITDIGHMKPAVKNCIGLFVVAVVALAWIGMVRDGHASTPTTSQGTQWATDCKAKMDAYALQQKARPPQYYIGIDNTCDADGQSIDNGAPAPDIAALIQQATDQRAACMAKHTYVEQGTCLYALSSH